MTYSALLKCPFCGGHAYIETIEPHTHKIATFMPDYAGGTMVACGNCHAANWRDGDRHQQAAIEAWNKRVWVTETDAEEPYP